jgi:hypothetical protein
MFCYILNACDIIICGRSKESNFEQIEKENKNSSARACISSSQLVYIKNGAQRPCKKTKHMGTSSAVADGETDHRATSSPITHVGAPDVTTK